MKNILLVDDDRLLAGVYRERLRAEGFAADVAHDGKDGLEMFERHRPDVVLLDLMLPQASGIEVLKAIRSQFGPREVPVIVITNAFIGGVLSQAWEAGANQVITKATMSPKLIIQLIQNALETASHPDVQQHRADNTAKTEEPEIDLDARAKLLESAPETLCALWHPLRSLVTERKNPAHLLELASRLRPLTAASIAGGLSQIAQMSTALEALLKDLQAKPQLVTPSVLLTVAQGFDTLKFLFACSEEPASQNTPVNRILVVDDDEFTRRSVKRALRQVNLRASCVDSAGSALQRPPGQRFGAILLDIEMPGVNGFDLCSRLRRMPQYEHTPIIFLTIHANFEERTESVLHGGDDFITKPFLFTELGVKVLSFVLRGTVRSGAVSGKLNDYAHGPEGFTRRDLNALKQALLSSLDREMKRSAPHKN